ncbi:MAG: hypothetical protein KME60_12140 [Cyanomargarita calcarea GSE-NOS-MK-12-04C]|jgi:hypothetical protein|uniref:Uncharacterized protein n=1 Tax=Cyanomargarita calcarea GSE-NOS-MK-12-04C TaxID=2839659 RepID=A0A951QP49_9CYAN|nr:hypothetical protein [Cyanomargarita calcarea GSE-NOS-MK-12-04C]
MKPLPLALIAAIAVMTMSKSAYANQENVPSTTANPNQASTLVTEPVTITNSWGSVVGENNNFSQTAGSISVVREQECKQIKPLELIQNPASFFKECPNQIDNRIPQYTEQIEYFKVPSLESGIRVNVTQF